LRTTKEKPKRQNKGKKQRRKKGKGLTVSAESMYYFVWETNHLVKVMN